MQKRFDLIAFDADDTLWENERLYTMGRERFNQIIARYPVDQDLDDQIHAIEIANLKYYGYGVMGFVMSLIEAAIRLTSGRVKGADIQELIDLAKEMLSAEVQLFEHVDKTLAALSTSYPLMLITKGDLLHQQSKIDRSGLKDYFRYTEIVSDKTPDIYAAILAKHQIEPSRFLMVGNSVRSDILPVIELGGWAIHIPNHMTWAYEAIQLPEGYRKRYFEAAHLGVIPELVAELQR